MNFIKFSLLSFALTLASTAFAQYDDGYFAKNFKSPTGNIICQGDGKGGDMHPENGVSCYIFDHDVKITPTSTKKDCDLDWTDGYTLSKAGHGKFEGLCHGDVFWWVNSPVLPYGKTVKGNGWQCTSKKTGMVCQNTQKHGFKISKKSQKVW